MPNTHARRPVTALPTTYSGVTFRSRVEARWAVFFDHLGVAWEYEPEGFELSPNRRYPPDFLLPKLWEGRGTWFEVKGDEPTRAEEARCVDLACGTGRRVVLAVHAPFPPSLSDLRSDGSLRVYYPSGGTDRGFAFFECVYCGHVDVAWPGLAHGCDCDFAYDSNPATTPRIMAAYAAARSERFGVFEQPGRSDGPFKHTCGSSQVLLTWFTFANGSRHIKQTCGGCGTALGWAKQTPENIAKATEPTKQRPAGSLFDAD